MSLSSHRIKGRHYQRDLSPPRLTLIIELEVVFVRFLTPGYFLSALSVPFSLKENHAAKSWTRELDSIRQRRYLPTFFFIIAGVLVIVPDMFI